MLTDEDIAKRNADVALMKRADELKEYLERLIYEGGRSGQIQDIRGAEWKKYRDIDNAACRDRDAAIDRKILEIMGSDYAASRKESVEADAKVEEISENYVFGEDGEVVRCLLTEAPITDADWYLTDGDGNYVLAEAAGLTREDDSEDDEAGD